MGRANVARGRNRGAHTGQHRANAFEQGCATAKHNGELARFGARHAPRDRCIDQMTFGCRNLLGECAGDGGYARTHFDDDGVGAQASQDTVWTSQHGLNDGAGRQDGDDDV